MDREELLRWLFLYNSLTSEQKVEVEAFAIKKTCNKFYNDSYSVDSALDKNTFLYWRNVLAALKSRFTLQNVRLIWNKMGISVKLRVRIKDSDIGGDKNIKEYCLEKLRSMKGYRMNAYDRAIVIRCGGVNMAFKNALTYRNELFIAIGMDPPNDVPNWLKSEDKLIYSNSERVSNFSSMLNMGVGLDAFSNKKVSLVDLENDTTNLMHFMTKAELSIAKQGNVDQKTTKRSICAAIENSAGLTGNLLTKKKFKPKEWNIETIRNVTIKTPGLSHINSKFKKTFMDLKVAEVDVVIVGAGIAGLVAANYLRSCGVNICVFEARNRIGGRTFTATLPRRSLPDGEILEETKIDLGASYFHCCNAVDFEASEHEENANCIFDPMKDARIKRCKSKSLLGMASMLKPNVSDVAGGANWETTIYTGWYDDIKGEKINLYSAAKANMIGEKIRVRAAKKVSDLRKHLKSLPKGKKFLSEEQIILEGSFNGDTQKKWYVTQGLYEELCNKRYCKKARKKNCSAMKPKNTSHETPIVNAIGERKSLWDIYLESIHEIFEELKICSENLSEIEWKLLFIIIQSRLGYNSDLRDTCVSMCRLPTIDEDLDSSINYLVKSNVNAYKRYVESTFRDLNKVNKIPFDGKSDADKLLIDGWDWLLDTLSNGLEDCLYLETKVTKIEVFRKNSVANEYVSVKAMSTAANEADAFKHLCTYVRAKYAIVCVPSTLLSSDHTFDNKSDGNSNKIHFVPPLDKRKCKALERYKMGHHNKVILRFNPKEIFWPREELQFNCTDEKFQFMNLDSYGKRGCLLAHSFPPFSVGWSGIKEDEKIVQMCLQLLQNIFAVPEEKMPYPVDALVTRWYSDSYSGGSYSYPGTDAVDEDIIHLKSPHPKKNARVLFAGEYLSSSYYQCVDGAFDTAMRAAEDVAHIGLNKPYPFPIDAQTPSLDGLFDPSFRDKYLNVPISIPDPQLIGYYLTDGSDERLTDSRFSSILQYCDLKFQSLPLNKMNIDDIRNEIDLLSRVRCIASKDVINISDFKQLAVSLTRDLERFKSKNYWNKYLEAAYRIIKSILKAAREYTRETGLTMFSTRSQDFSLKVYNAASETNGFGYDYICWDCLGGGEVLLCDSPSCNKVWHIDCIPSQAKYPTTDDSKAWICPACTGHSVERGRFPVEEAVSLYWMRRGSWWRVKALVSLCRLVYRRIQDCKKELEDRLI